MVRTLLFEVKVNDMGAIAAVAGLICLVAIAAGYVPARRAAGLEPVRALRVG